MGRQNDIDPLQEWGPEAAVIALIGGIVVAVGILVYSVLQGGRIEDAAAPALGVAALGGAIALGIMMVRKRRERATRPAWMGSTQEWREEIISRKTPPPDRRGTGGE